MNQEEAQNDYDSLLLERRECLAWLSELTRSSLHSKNKSVTVTVPAPVHRCLFGSSVAVPSEEEKSYILRRLNAEEVQVLVDNQCTSQDWTRIWLFSPSSDNEDTNSEIDDETVLQCLKHRVSSTCFAGSFVILGWPVAGVRKAARQKLGPPATRTNTGSIFENGTSNIANSDSGKGFAYEDPTETEVTYGSKSNGNAIFTNNEWDLLPQGIFQTAVVADSFVQLDAWVHQNRFVSRVLIASYAAVMGCGKVTAAAPWNPYNQTIKVGPESGGGRYLTVTPQDTMVSISQQLTADTSPFKSRRASQRASLKASGMSSLLRASISSVGSGTKQDESNTTYWTLISRGSVIRETVSVSCVYMHLGATIQGASLVEGCVLFPTAEIVQGGCTVTNSFLQWQCTIQDASSVSNCFMMEASHVGPHSKIRDSILGPDVALSSGEVQSCVLGPNASAHHQSLLVGLLWLHGRGSVGFGAKVGTNHTGRVPDQEGVCGEGIFWGLSTSVIYPINLLNSPYSIISDGAQLSPGQVIQMPFSLILQNDESGTAEIVPAWVLMHSPYTLARCTQKMLSRRNAVHHEHYASWPVTDRKDLLIQVFKARHALRNVVFNGKKEWYNVAGNESSELGRLKLSEKSRKHAIQAYSDFLQRSALLALLEWLEADPTALVILDLLRQTAEQRDEIEDSVVPPAPSDGDEEDYVPTWPELPWMVEDLEDDTLHFQLFILVTEFGLFLQEDEENNGDIIVSNDPDIDKKLNKLLHKVLIQLNDNYLRNVKISKLRDDVRGEGTIPDYDVSHVSAELHKVVTQLEKQLDEIFDRVEAVVHERIELSNMEAGKYDEV